MDALLKLAADAGVEVSAAEGALEEEAYQSARDALDRAGDLLAELRARWPAMGTTERAVIGPAAGAVRQRLDEAAARVPLPRTVTEGLAELDPEQEREPEQTPS